MDDKIENYEQNQYTDEIINCFRVVVYNNRGAITKYQLIALDDSILYESDNYTVWETWIYNLDTLKLQVGTQFKVKALNQSARDAINNTVLTYMPNFSTIPNPATVYFESYLEDANNGPKLTLIDKIYSSYTPPILPCSKIYVDNECTDFVSLEIYTIDGKVVKKTDASWNSEEIDLTVLDIEIGTHLKLKAAITGGTDQVAYVTLEYSPQIYDTAKFQVWGLAQSIMLEYLSRV